jgi:hypothetical protein
MMNIKAIAFLSLLTLSTLSAPAFSQTVEIDVSKIPTINNKDWRTPSTFSPPWSTPVLVNDEFDGTYLAVFDHNFQKVGGFLGWGGREEIGMTTNWSPKVIRAYGYVINSGGTTIKETSSLTIKVGSKIFQLTGEKGNFAVTPELAYSLKTAPLEVARIKIEYKDSGIPIVSDIGTATVTAWRTVYQQAKDPGQVSSTPEKVNQPVVAASSDRPTVTQLMAVPINQPKAKQKRFKH